MSLGRTASLLAVLLAPPLFACGAGQASPVPPPSAPASPSARVPAAGETVAIDDELTVRAVAPGAFVVTHRPFFRANVLVVRMPDGTVVFCSSPMEDGATRAMIRWAVSALSPSRMVAVNTHFHFDGTGGNHAYREAGVVTYASTHTQRLLAEKGVSMRAEAAAEFTDPAKRARMAALPIEPAKESFAEADGLTLKFGGEEVRVVYPGAAHAPDNVVVHFPARRLVFGGCMIKGMRSIGYVGHADLGHWEAAAEAVRALGATTVVPGHGDPGGPELFDLTVAVVREARAAKPAE